MSSSVVLCTTLGSTMKLFEGEVLNAFNYYVFSKKLPVFKDLFFSKEANLSLLNAGDVVFLKNKNKEDLKVYIVEKHKKYLIVSPFVNRNFYFKIYYSFVV